MIKPEIIYCWAGDPRESAPHSWMPACWLHGRGYEVSLLCQGNGQHASISTPFGVLSARFLGGNRWVYHSKLLGELLRARTNHNETAVFYVHGHNSTPAAWLALSGVNRWRLVYHTQDFLEPGRHPHWEFFEKRFARRAAWVISNEPNRARFMASHYRLRQMPIVVPTALPKDWPRPERDQHLRNAILAQVNKQDSDNCRLVMHEGAYSPLRCGRQLVEAFCRLPGDFSLVFTDVTPNNSAAAELRQLVEQFRLQQRVVLLERLSFADLLRRTACCDLGILLYPNDGLGNFYQAPGRLTHYIGCGLPVVASNFPGLELLILKHNLGLTCDPYSPQSIADAIRKLGARPKDALAEHGKTLRLLARNELAYEAYAGQIEEILKRIPSKQGCL